MKKVIVINASPRKNFSTAKLLKEAKKGAESVGVEVEYIDLVKLNFKGCLSCYACKRKDAKTKGLCAYKDELTPVLKKILDAKAVIVGTPIYYGNHTGLFRNFYERVCFPVLTYMKDEASGFTKRVLDYKIPFGIINTMGATEEQYKKTYMPALFKATDTTVKLVFGYCQTMNVYDTSHVADYSKYDFDLFNIERKKAVKDLIFPKDLERAFQLGKKLAEFKEQ